MEDIQVMSKFTGKTRSSTDEADGEKIIAEIEAVLEVGTQRRKVVKVETWEDPSTLE